MEKTCFMQRVALLANATTRLMHCPHQEGDKATYCMFPRQSGSIIVGFCWHPVNACQYVYLKVREPQFGPERVAKGFGMS